MRNVHKENEFKWQSDYVWTINLLCFTDQLILPVLSFIAFFFCLGKSTDNSIVIKFTLSDYFHWIAWDLLTGARQGRFGLLSLKFRIH